MVVDKTASVSRHHFASQKKRIWNLGLIRIKGTMDAETIVKKIRERLDIFGISLDRHIVCQMTDGCKTMKKVGKICSCDQQLCLAHGVQLAVLDVLYKKPKPKAADEDEHEHDNEAEEESLSDDEDDDEDDIGDDDLFSFADNVDEVDDDDGFVLGEDEGVARELPDNLKGAVDKVRQIVKKFKNSPLKNDVLQSYVTDEFKSESQLKLDCKTRWNSLLDMCDRFCVLQKPIRKALVDVGAGLSISDEELHTVSKIVDALKPVKAAVEALCRRDANLLTADAILSFAMSQLQQQNTDLSIALFDALEKRISERRTHLSGILKYLHTGSLSNVNSSADDSDGNMSADILDIFDMPSKRTVESGIVQLLTRLDSEQGRDKEAGVLEQPPLVTSDSDLHKHTKNNQRSRSALHQDLDTAITKAMKTNVESRTIQSETSLLKLVRQEMRLLEGGGGRGRYLTKVYEYLLGVKPTSIESERAFSSCVYLCPKLRCRMADKTLDNLSFLRAYFQEQKSV